MLQSIPKLIHKGLAIYRIGVKFMGTWALALAVPGIVWLALLLRGMFYLGNVGALLPGWFISYIGND
ncbi:MAG: hypothetical protein AAF821_10785 [Cyanobacteria bacterium P01_D01_bin.156]